MAFLLKNSLQLALGKQFIKLHIHHSYQFQVQTFKTASVIRFPNRQNPDDKKSNDLSKKHKEQLKITLWQNQNMTVTALEDAKNLAKRRSMHLVKTQDMDPKTQRPVYKLLTAAEMLQAELSEIKNTNPGKSPAGGTKKAEKSLSIGSRIAEHDLSSRLKNISKWLSKQHEVRVLIQSNSEKDLSNAENIFKTIEESIKTPQVIGRIVQKRTKGNIIKFNILPTNPTIPDKPTGSSQ